MIKGSLNATDSAYADEVTGSKTLLTVETDRRYRILIDLGIVQERNHKIENYYNELDYGQIDAVFITHNHMDHVGGVATAYNRGLRCPIYITKVSLALGLKVSLLDGCQHQEENAAVLRREFPDEADKIKVLHTASDVQGVMGLFVGVDYWDDQQSDIEIGDDEDENENEIRDYRFESSVNAYESFCHKKKHLQLTKNEKKYGFEIIEGSGIYAKFYKNGHILGAAMVVITAIYGQEKMTFVYSGDYRRTSPWQKIPPLPGELLNAPNVVLTTESTYGTTDSGDITRYFKRNILEAIRQRKDILLGAFARERMQVLLLFFKNLEADGLLPKDYRILVDGSLGITLNRSYKRVLEAIHSSNADFIPERVEYVDPKQRSEIVFKNDAPKIIISTSGMLSMGPARFYIPYFLGDPKKLIHLCGYAVEGTLARYILDASVAPYKDITSVNDWSYKDVDGSLGLYENIRTGEIVNADDLAKEYGIVECDKQLYTIRCEVKSTGEFSSHAPADDLIRMISKFKNLQFVIINHGEAFIKEAFLARVLEDCDNVTDAGVINRTTMFRFFFAIHNRASSFTTNCLTTKFISDPRIVFGNRKKKEKLRFRGSKGESKYSRGADYTRNVKSRGRGYRK